MYIWNADPIHNEHKQLKAAALGVRISNVEKCDNYMTLNIRGVTFFLHISLFSHYIRKRKFKNINTYPYFQTNHRLLLKYSENVFLNLRKMEHLIFLSI